MKTIIFALGIVALMGVSLEVFYNSPEEVINEATESTVTEIQVETIDVLEERIKDAQNAEMDSLEASAQAVYDEYLQKELKRIEDEVKAEYISEIEATITSDDY